MSRKRVTGKTIRKSTCKKYSYTMSRKKVTGKTKKMRRSRKSRRKSTAKKYSRVRRLRKLTGGAEPEPKVMISCAKTKDCPEDFECIRKPRKPIPLRYTWRKRGDGKYAIEISLDRDYNPNETMPFRFKSLGIPDWINSSYDFRAEDFRGTGGKKGDNIKFISDNKITSVEKNEGDEEGICMKLLDYDLSVEEQKGKQERLRELLPKLN